MSWYIEYLLRHKDEIKYMVVSNIGENQYVDYLDDYTDFYGEVFSFGDEDDLPPSATMDYSFSYDMYDDVLYLEKLISDLHQEELLDSEQIKLINIIGTGKFLHTIGEELGTTRETVTKRFLDVCDDLDYYSKGIYSDETFLKELKENRKLDNKQMSIVERFIKSKWKNKIIQKVRTEGE